ncbi:MAG: ATP-binding cassette domain-containing protein [Synergistaceae bacterium]|jgi:phosphate transport system ATP-binding protein|nr:ATP-binding cassette domain-containing protein [Synergistaceae bacterium]
MTAPSIADREFCAAIRGLSVRFGDRQALKGVDIDFPAKRISVLLGRSGSGKTTLLRSFNRLNECFEGYEGTGTVKLGGIAGAPDSLEEVNALPLSRLRRLVGMVFQTPNPLPLSIRKNLLLPLTLVAGLETDEAEEAMKRSLTAVGLWKEVADRLDRPAFSLSGGQRQRLCLARVLALEPEILLLDEPTASLDRLAAAVVEDLILSLKGRYSIVMVSHSLAQAGRLGDFLAVLTDGRVEETMAASALPKGAEAEKFLEKLL